MTTDPLFQRWRDISWQRPLTPAEQAELRSWLAVHPEAQADWETEAALAEALTRLPDVPVASNFTARVLQAVEREQASPQPRRLERLRRLWQGTWLPRLAAAAMVLGLGLLSYQAIESAQRQERARVQQQRTRVVARSLVQVSEAVAVADNPAPEPEILQDYAAIQASSRPSSVEDEELLAVLSKLK